MLIALQIYAQVFNPGGGIQKRAEKLCQKSSGNFCLYIIFKWVARTLDAKSLADTKQFLNLHKNFKST